MKKIFTLIALLTTVGGAASAAVGDKFEDEAKNFVFVVKSETDAEKTVELNKYQGKDGGEVAIPSYIEIDGAKYDVTSIAARAFAYAKTITSITVPETIVEIGKACFQGCILLDKIALPNTITVLNSDLFSRCESLTSFVVPSAVTVIDDYAFDYCKSLTALQIPESVTEIKKLAFRECAFESLELPSGLTTLGQWVFSGCPNLKTLEIPAAVTTIGDGFTRGCDALETISVAEGNGAFKAVDGALYNADATVLVAFPGAKTEAVLPESVTEIANSAFEQCHGLVKITFGDALVKIGDKAFNECTALEEAPLPASVSSLGQYVFGECHSLKATNISGVETIPAYGFYNCKALQSAVIGDVTTTINEHAFYGCESLTELTLGNAITTIGKASFSKCTALTEFTIPASVTSIGNFAIQYNTGLKAIYSYPTVPPTAGYNAFNSLSEDVVVYVPQGTLEEYAAAAEWKTLLNYKEMSTSGVNDIEAVEEAVAPVYYNLQGVEVQNPDAGVYIVRRGSKIAKELVR